MVGELTRMLYLTPVPVLVLASVGCTGKASEPPKTSSQATEVVEEDNIVPYFEADPTWPKPLPNTGRTAACSA